MDVNVVNCKKYSDMQGGRFFIYSFPLLSKSLELAVGVGSLVSQSREAFKLDVLELTAMQASWLGPPLLGLLIRRETSSFWKSVSSKGTGRGVVQLLSTMHEGRPVRTLRRCSTVYKDHHTRYLISLEVSEVQSPTFRRCNPRAKAPWIALPVNFQDLNQECQHLMINERYAEHTD